MLVNEVHHSDDVVIVLFVRPLSPPLVLHRAKTTIFWVTVHWLANERAYILLLTFLVSPFYWPPVRLVTKLLRKKRAKFRFQVLYGKWCHSRICQQGTKKESLFQCCSRYMIGNTPKYAAHMTMCWPTGRFSVPFHRPHSNPSLPTWRKSYWVNCETERTNQGFSLKASRHTHYQQDHHEDIGLRQDLWIHRHGARSTNASFVCSERVALLYLMAGLQFCPFCQNSWSGNNAEPRAILPAHAHVHLQLPDDTYQHVCRL